MIFITGDIANRGASTEYTQFIDEFLTPLQNLYGEDTSSRTFVVPGNHDVQRGINKYFDRNEICAGDSLFFDPTKSGSAERQQVLPRFKNYSEQTMLTPISWLDSEMGGYVTSLELRGAKIGIVGINTAWLSKDDSDRHNLSIGVSALDDALQQLNGCQYKIVLGHHPIDWLRDEHVPAIRATLGRHSALYLHGHLHKNRASPEDGAGNGFLTIQCGAGFQNRSIREEWVNGLLWAELHRQNAILRLQPLKWGDTNKNWAPSHDLPENRRIPNTDWWGFPLPGIRRPITNVANPDISTVVPYPDGWQSIDAAFLERQAVPLETTSATRFFDGANPTWGVALSSDIPRLSTVSTVVQNFESFKQSSKPRVIALIGPAGEGKSTSLRQIATRLVESPLRLKLLWHADDTKSINEDELLALPETERQWLLISDSADLIAVDVFRICERLKKTNRTDIWFLLACRDTDWIAARAHQLSWGGVAEMLRAPISGLELVEARAIVNSWAAFESGDALQIDEGDQVKAANELFEAAQKATPLKGGALLGAILKIRYRDGLLEHVKLFMERFAARKIPGGRDLLDAFAYTAAMHVAGTSYLSRAVLSDVLGCRFDQLSPFVLLPLGMEAATSHDGQFVLTRHIEIARTALTLLRDVFEVDVDSLYLELVTSAEKLRAQGEFVPNLRRWHFDLAAHFFSEGRRDLAIRIGETLIRMNPTYVPLRTHLARLYREAGDPGRASSLFYSIDSNALWNRGVLSEWGRDVMAAGHHIRGSMLVALSLTCVQDAKSAGRCLGALADSLEMLFDDYRENRFKMGYLSAARLSLLLGQTNEYEQHFTKLLSDEGQSTNAVDVERDLTSLEAAISQMKHYFQPESGNLADATIGSSSWDFTHVRRLLQNAYKTKQVQPGGAGDAAR